MLCRPVNFTYRYQNQAKEILTLSYCNCSGRCVRIKQRGIDIVFFSWYNGRWVILVFQIRRTWCACLRKIELTKILYGKATKCICMCVCFECEWNFTFNPYIEPVLNSTCIISNILLRMLEKKEILLMCIPFKICVLMLINKSRSRQRVAMPTTVQRDKPTGCVSVDIVKQLIVFY